MPVASPILAEYAAMVLPELYKTLTLMSFFDSDPFFDKMRKSRRVRRQGGTTVYMTRVRKGDVTFQLLNEATTSINTSHTNIFSRVECNWFHYIGAIVFPWFERDRLVDAADVTRWIKLRTLAATQQTTNQVRRQIYHGQAGVLGVDPNNVFTGISTLNGSITGLPCTGLENGLLQFVDAASQTGTYLTETRNRDSVEDMDNWHNHFSTHPGMGSGFWDAFFALKILADSYADEQIGGVIDSALLSIGSMSSFWGEIRNTSGGTSRIMLTPADVKAGRVFPSTTIVEGVNFHYPRQFTDAYVGGGVVQPVYGLNPASFEYMVNKEQEFRADGKMIDGSYSQKPFDYTFIHNQTQLACMKPTANMCLKRA